MASSRSLPARAADSFLRIARAMSFLCLALVGINQTAQAQSIANGAALWANPTYLCSSCHGATPALPQKNASNAVSVLNAAIANDAGAFMSYFRSLAINGVNGTAPLNATQRADLAAFIGSNGTVADSNAHSVSVAYHGSQTITPLNLVVSNTGPNTGTITAISRLTGPASGNLSSNTITTAGGTFTYNHTANNCTADTVTYNATGGGGTSATKTVTINVTAPTAPTISNSSSSIAYSTSPTAIPLTLGGGSATSLIVGALSGGAGTLTPSGTSLTYTASSSVYAASQTFTVQAVGPCATSAPATITLNVAAPPAPVITSLLTASATGGQAFTYNITASNAPTSYNATGLPAGLSVNTSTGAITGTPTVSGPFTVMISATNGTGTTTQALALTVSLVTPVITSSLAVPATSGAAFTYTITANNLPSSFNATGLPSGLSINTGTGVISGTPVVALGGPVNVSISATNTGGTDTKTLVITVSLNAPTINSANTASGTVGAAFNFPVTATDFPTSYAATGLPAGLSINTTTGVISGTPTLPGVSSVALTATNGSGNGTQTLTITVILLAPVVTSANTASGTLLQSFNYQITATNGPTSFNATGLPPGLGVNTTTGAITGTPTTAGTYTTTVTATNATGPGTRVVTITINNPPAPGAFSTTLNTAYGASGTIELATVVSGIYTSIALASQPAHGTATINGTVVTFVPANGFFGNDSFTFNVTGLGGTTQGTINIIVASPGKPTATDATVKSAFNTPATINLAGSVTGVFNSVAITTAPANGTATLNGNVVTYVPKTGYFGDDSFAYTATGPGGTSDPATVTITVGTLAPTARAVKFIVPLNTATAMDLAPFIAGSALTGVRVAASPAHGSAAVNGMKVIYTPATDFFGDDSFTYVAFGNAGTSPAAVVTVTVVGRPDPTKDAATTGLLAAQADSSKRFAQAQIGNFQSRLESLHRNAEVPAPLPVKIPAAAPTTPPVAPKKEAVSRSFSDDVATVERRAGMVQVANKAENRLPDLGNAEPPIMQAAVTAQAISLVTSGSLNLAGIAGGTTANGVTQVGTTNFWTAGTANFGSRSATGARNGLDFTTDGLTVGMDRRFTNVLSMGLGMGFGRDRTDVGTDGSRSRGRGVSFAGYGSYQVSPNIFVDGLLGIGTLNFKTDRYVKPINDFAHNDRDGTQIFASVSGGYEMRSDGVLLSPYGRIDYSSNRLKQSTESGAGLYALSYASQTTPSLQGVLGFRAETVNRTDFGFAAPRARIEYRHQFQGERLQGISYADQIGGQYQISSGSVTRNELVLGMGSDFQFRRGLTVGLDYQFQYAFPKDKSQGLRLLVTQDLDGKSSPFSLAAFPLSFSKPKDFQVDAGFTFEDNVTRARASADKLSDRSYSVNVAKGFKFELNDNTRAIVTPSFGAMSFDNYKGLNRASAGVSGEVQYRTSGDYNVPTFAAFAEIGGDYFDSDLRRGYSYVLGGSISAQLTDRIALVGAIRHSERYSKSSVFNSRHNSIRLNADYLWTNNDTIYVTGEYRRGQITSTGRPSLENIDVADLFVQDNAFPAGQFFTYRFNANTVISTLGYNRGFGPRHSLDLSWRRAQSSPTKSGLNGTGTSYVTDLYSLIYLIRF